MASQEPPYNYFDDNKETLWRFLNEIYASVFVFENNSTQTLNINMELELTNLRLCDEPDGATTFSVSIPPG